MNPSNRRIPFSALLIIILLAACTPAPAVTQNSESSQQQIDEIVTETLRAQNSQINNVIQPADATGTAQSIQASNQGLIQTSVAETVTALQAMQPVATETQVSPAPPANPCDSIPTDAKAPTITSISPGGGYSIGGSIVTIKGTNFIRGQGNTHFCFGKFEASVVICVSTTQCTAVTPIHPEGKPIVNVVAFNDTTQAVGTASANSFTYIVLDPTAPVIKNIKPQEGTIRGGTKVTVTGEHFVPGKQGVEANVTQFFFGNYQATNVVCTSDLQCTMTSPGGIEGFVTVKAKNGAVESQHIPGNDLDGFKYNGIPKYGCGVVTITPENLTVFKPEESFVIKWIVKNTGQNTWPAGVDVKYASGVDMANPDYESIPVALQPNDTFPITINAKAPKDPGKYSMTWIVEGQGCQAYVVIVVE